MVNIGIDFGSTYTTISVYRQDTHMVESLTMAASPYIPTTVALDGYKYEFGRAARSVTGKYGVTLFKGFKMLLAETDQAFLAARGYSEKHNPRQISAKFLEYCLRKALADLRETRISQLVVGVPEIWNEQPGSLDARAVLRDLLLEMDFVENVQVVSEPAAATAFFAHNFRIMTGKEYEGCILLIDYGGGTLDLTLTNVSMEQGGLEIKVLERTGAGENEDGNIGKAGIVYMESVMERAIRQSGFFGDKPPAKDGRFYKAVDNLEEQLQFRTEAIKAVFDEYGVDYPEDLELDFTVIDYRGEYIPVTYRLLLEVYNDIIRPVLDEKLRQMIDFMEQHEIPYMNRDQEVFKIALVGGFGNYYLVKNQIEDVFRFSTMDKRQENIIQHRADREKSISMGAAMLSAGVVSIRNTAPFSIGFPSRDADGNRRVDYAIHYKQDIEHDKPYFPLDSDGKPLRYLMTSGSITRLVTNSTEDESNAKVLPLSNKLIQFLSGAAEPMQTAALGFSLDSSGILSLHVHSYPLDSAAPADSGKRIELAKRGDLFAEDTGRQVDA